LSYTPRQMQIRSTTWVPLVIVLGVAGLSAGALALLDYAQDEGERSDWVEHRRQEQARATEREEGWFETAEAESRAVIPELLSGVTLGMTVEELQEARENAATTDSRTDTEKFWYEEQFSIGAQAMYGFDNDSRRLVQLQILSRLPSAEAIGPHLAAMHDTYGVPSGIWHCPNTGGVPTRRFTWRRGVTTVMDIFLAHAGGVSQTLYIASSEVIQRSLAQSNCRPIRDREEMRTMPAVVGQQERLTREEVPPGVLAPPRRPGPPQGAPPQGAPPPQGYDPRGGPPPGASPEGYPPQGYDPRGGPPPRGEAPAAPGDRAPLREGR